MLDRSRARNFDIESNYNGSALRIGMPYVRDVRFRAEEVGIIRKWNSKSGNPSNIDHSVARTRTHIIVAANKLRTLMSRWSIKFIVSLSSFSFVFRRRQKTRPLNPKSRSNLNLELKGHVDLLLVIVQTLLACWDRNSICLLVVLVRTKCATVHLKFGIEKT